MNYEKFEKDETQAIQKIIEEMNYLHCKMGGRSVRPERKALEKAMAVLQKEIDRSRSVM